MTSLHVAAIAIMQCSTSQGRSPKKEMGITPVMKAELKYSSIIYIQNPKNAGLAVPGGYIVPILIIGSLNCPRLLYPPLS